ncbi:hypothetical protein H1C71_005194 [Ictidomys tridecemlineatus]|nr:hypothetical protein H1C71_005194 [Ictidomys tridecemlineatus]
MEEKRLLSQEAIMKIPVATIKNQVREFLGAVRYCHLWIPGFAEIAKPLYTVTAGGSSPLAWTKENEESFKYLKKALVLVLALTLPDISKHFHLYVHEKRGIAKGVLTQNLGPWKRQIAYISKKA